ncbi:MAG: hypothetical protein ACYC0V_18150 [Armatimonadota bacterium]
MLKHYVRQQGWLPICQSRLARIRKLAGPRRQPRRLRYFTFCAVGAVDVLMLDVAKVIRPSDGGRFDTVFFFDKDSQHVMETQRSIPGSVGFVGDFVNTVLLPDPAEQSLLDSNDILSSSETEENIYSVRAQQRQLSERREFLRSFPFDVVNLDLEEFVFKPSDPYPGKLMNALRKVFSWQQRPLTVRGRPPEQLGGFSLMFTTRIGPPNLNEEYLQMLRNYLLKNIQEDNKLLPILYKRAGVGTIECLQQRNFDVFFKLALPKILANALMENDWFIEPKHGISIFEFERPCPDGFYKMLHLVMDVSRKNPPIDQRAPGVDSEEARDAYRAVTYQIFAKDTDLVTEDRIILEERQEELRTNLEFIKARRRKYYDGETPDDTLPHGLA